MEEERARAVGRYLKENGFALTKVYAAPLKRTMETAKLALNEAGVTLPVFPEEGLREIDYGVDENRPEDDVVERLGKEYLAKENAIAPTREQIVAKGNEVIDAWNKKAVLPDGWMADVPAMIDFWKNFAAAINENETVLVVSSNGTIRFAPYITSDYDAFCATHDIKVATGGVCLFENDGLKWICREWNLKPFKTYALS